MARSRASQASSRRATSRSAGRRASEAEVEVVEEPAGGMDWESAVCLITTVLLVTALLLVDYEMGKAYGAGVLF